MKTRLLFTVLALLALVYVWASLTHISRTDPWYRNADMNIHNVVDALSLNSGYTLGVVDQPAAPTKFLLALDFRVRNALSDLPVWTAKRFVRSPDPFPDYARLVHVGREHSRSLVFLLILLSAGFVGHVTRRYEAACLTIILLCGSAGLLFHGLLVRPELLCTALGGVLALYAVWLGCRSSSPTGRTGWLLLAGLAVGLALLSKLPALYYCLLLCAWCWLTPLFPSLGDSATSSPRISLGLAIGGGLFAGVGLLGLLSQIHVHADLLDPIALFRLRLAASVVALLPLTGFIAASSRWGRYFVQGILDTAILLAGVLSAFVLWFGLLRLLLPAESAGQYMAKILNTVFFPDILVTLFTKPEESHRLHQFLRFYWETPVLISATALLSAFLLFCRGLPTSTKLLVALLFAQASGMALLLSKRQFLEQYSVFVQVPLLLSWPVALAALQTWWQARTPVREHKWPVVLATGVAILLVLIHPLELRFKYDDYQDDAMVPVRDLTVTFLYDHDAHPAAFIAAMKARHPDRQAFTIELDHYLNDPTHRY